MTRRVVWRLSAQQQLAAIYYYISKSATPGIASRLTDAIEAFCEGLAVFPERGLLRDDLRPGLRLVPFRKRVIIAIRVEPNQVSIIGVFYGGQDYESTLAD